MNEFEKQMAEAKVYRRFPIYKNRLDFAIAGVHKMLACSQRVYVSLSFGKQSTCLAHMIYQIAPKTEMHFLASEETWNMYDYENVIDSFVTKWPVNLTVHQTNNFFGASTWEESRDSGDMDLQKMCRREDYDGWFWGLSVDESPVRKKTLLAAYKQDTPHPSIYRYSDGKYRCCPLMYWESKDLAAYILTHDIPILNIYRRYGLQQRTTARITKKMLRNQGMALCRMTNSTGYRKLVDKFQEINVQ
jgi:3'-phosphoadenosine 5'-phosphosulfate sulfotransferase (PAPS reductase)/FAD synthetase